MMRVVILGSGNVATHLAHALDPVAYVAQVYSRDAGHARRLADSLGRATVAATPADVVTDADMYLVAVSDDAIAELAGRFADNDAIWAHTSGSVGMDALSGKRRRGVFYPLQTFSQQTAVDFSRVPMLIEASDDDVHRCLTGLARSITSRVSDADSDTRRRLHVAAVFASNFANYMWTIADDLLHDVGRDIRDFDALLHATLDKALSVGPYQGQTGPARRGDDHVIERHLQALDGPASEVYRLLSSQIKQRYEQD